MIRKFWHFTQIVSTLAATRRRFTLEPVAVCTDTVPPDFFPSKWTAILISFTTWVLHYIILHVGAHKEKGYLWHSVVGALYVLLKKLTKTFLIREFSSKHFWLDYFFTQEVRQKNDISGCRSKGWKPPSTQPLCHCATCKISSFTKNKYIFFYQKLDAE